MTRTEQRMQTKGENRPHTRTVFNLCCVWLRRIVKQSEKTLNNPFVFRSLPRRARLYLTGAIVTDPAGAVKTSSPPSAVAVTVSVELPAVIFQFPALTPET